MQQVIYSFLSFKKKLMNVNYYRYQGDAYYRLTLGCYLNKDNFKILYQKLYLTIILSLDDLRKKHNL